MRTAAPCFAFALIAACGSQQPSRHDSPPPPATPAADAAPLSSPSFAQKSCLPDEAAAEEPTDAGAPGTPTGAKAPPIALLRVRTRRDVDPAPDHRRALWRRHGRKGVIVAVKVCADVDGRVVSVRLLKGSGYTPYDEQVMREVSCWTFHPAVVDGAPTRACSVVTAIYRPSPPSFAPGPP